MKRALAWSAVCVMGLGCSGAAPATDENAPATVAESATSSVIKFVFVIAMENHDASSIIGNTTDAPYINNTLLPSYAQATNFNDALALSIPSEPHYVWMEAGTNAFSDHTFSGDGAPTSSNSTSSTAHLATQIKNATNGVTWRSYQEGLNGTTGACPIAGSGFYAPKHDPFIFFKDVSGNPPAKTNAYCGAHHRAYGAFAADLAASDVASYTFITPNLCNDMHGATGCPNSNKIRSGDDWLKGQLPRLISFVNAHSGVVFITWDEGESSAKIPFIAVGPGVKTHFSGTTSYTHSSLVKSIDEILGLSVLSKVSSANDLSNLFKAGFFP